MKRHRFLASVLAFTLVCPALRVSAGDEKKPEPPKDERPINALAKVAASDANAREDMAKRFARFMLDGDGGKASYVTAEARKDGMDKRLAGLPKTWVEKKIKDGGAGAASVIEFYYVLGDDQAPKWAQSLPELKDELGGYAREQLISNMKPWTGEAAAKQGDNPGVKAGQLDKPDGNLEDWVNRFLDSAANSSHEIIVAKRIPKDKKPGLIGEHEEENPVLGNLGGKSRVGASAGFDDMDLFIGGAKTMRLYQEGDKSSRDIAVKMVSYKTENGIVNEIGICDLTYPSDRFCRHYTINNSGGEQTMPLDDRTPGQKQYTLSFTPSEDGQVKIRFGRPAAVADGKGGKGPVIETSVKELAGLRAQHVLEMNRLVVINGVEFLAAGQTAGTTGEHLYYRKDRLQSENIVDVTPEFVAQVISQSGGQAVIAKGKVDLGMVKGKPYHTYYDAEARKFKIGEGPGDAPKPPGTATGDTGTGGNPGTGNTNPGGGGGTPDTNAEDQFLSAGYYAPNREVNDAIRPTGLLRVHDATPKGIEWLKNYQNPDNPDMAAAIRKNWWRRLHIMFIPKVSTGVIYVDFEGAGQYKEGSPPILVVKDSHYLLSVSDAGRRFLNLKAKPTPQLGFPVAARILTPADGPKSIAMVDGSDMEIVSLVIAEVVGKDKAEKALANLAEVSKGRQLDGIRGSSEQMTAIFKEGEDVQFWPTIIHMPQTGGSYPDATGKGNTIFEHAPGGPPDDFKDAVDVGPADKLEKLHVYDFDDPKLNKKLKKKDAVLYVNDVPKGQGTKDKPRKWFIQFNFKVQGSQYRSLFVEMPINEGVAQAVPFPYGANPPIDINEDGVMKQTEEQAKLDLMNTGTHGRVVNSANPTPDKGVYAVFVSRGDSRSKKENCLAPILWWGMDKAAAVTACEKDGY